MNIREQISLEEVLDYVRGNSHKKMGALIESFHGKVLKELLDQLKKMYDKDLLKNEKNVGESDFFRLADETLYQFFSGGLQLETATAFLHALEKSPVVFDILLSKIESDTPEVNEQHYLELQESLSAEYPRIVEKIKNSVKGSDVKREKNQWKIAEKLQEYFSHLFLPAKMPRAAWAVVFACVVIIGGYFYVSQINGSGDQWRQYLKKGDYSGTQFKGSGIFPESDSLEVIIRNNFNAAMSDYLYEDYSAAIEKFDALNAQLAALKPEKKYSQLRRDLNFYQGLAYLFLTSDRKISAKMKSNYLEKSESHIKRAIGMANKLSLDKTGREYYYLGLIYAIQNQPDSAMVWLVMIDSNSSFYHRAEEIVRKLEKH
ncbi:MAG: hypothetical protein GXO74_09130 [Calditrichaeota bacterium]|nr:hypothetical protein [Calditrichota bacterium]